MTAAYPTSRTPATMPDTITINNSSLLTKNSTVTNRPRATPTRTGGRRWTTRSSSTQAAISGSSAVHARFNHPKLSWTTTNAEKP